ncbi:MAG: P-type conjugative transfer protein TrbJ [Dermatophilaceae bacterium]
MKILAAKVSALTLLLVLGNQTQAGIPVIDVAANALAASNVSQTTTTAVEAVAQTIKQIQQYATQLQQLEQQYQAYATQVQQYQNMVQNTVAPAAYIWNQAQSVMTQLRGATDTLSYYRNQVGSVDAYLAKYQDVNYYRNSPCYTATGCSAEQKAAEEKAAIALGSEAQKKANDAMLKGLEQQQEAIITDATRLEQLQSNAQTAQGQMEAIGYASQIAGEQTNQLLQMRGLLVAQQNAIATKMQADADKEARQTAADEKFRAGNLDRPNTGKTWGF